LYFTPNLRHLQKKHAEIFSGFFFLEQMP